MDPFLDTIISQLQDYFDPESVGAQVAEILADTLVALIIFLLFYLLWHGLRYLFRSLVHRTDLDETAVAFLETIIKYTVLTIGVINALGAIGVNTASLLTSLGIVGLTVGFAARDAFSNLISGLLIFIDRPFVIGDLVEIEDNYGRVDQIKLRSTRIVTSDGKMLAVPNSDIINKIVASYTNFPHLRLDIPVTIAVDESLDRVRELLLGLVTGHPDYLPVPVPRMVVTALNDYNVEVELQAWIRDERQHVIMRSDLREEVFETLTAAGVDMPFETIQVVAPQDAGNGNP